MINEAEALAALVWLETFRACLQGADLVLFLESEAAEGSLLKGYSSSRSLTAIAGALWALSASLQARLWVGRMPSRLNPSDEVSRRDRHWAREQDWSEWPATEPPVAPWRLLLEGEGAPAP